MRDIFFEDELENFQDTIRLLTSVFITAKCPFWEILRNLTDSICKTPNITLLEIREKMNPELIYDLKYKQIQQSHIRLGQSSSALSDEDLKAIKEHCSTQPLAPLATALDGLLNAIENKTLI